MREKLLLLDFDGTLCLGDDPVLAYAGQVDRLLAEEGLPGLDDGGIRGVVRRAFAEDRLLVPEIRFDESGHPRGVDSEPVRRPEQRDPGGAGRAHPVSWPLQDGYQLVQLLAVQSGLTDAQTGQAFREARRVLVDQGLDRSEVHAPDGVHDFLRQVRERAVVVLVTNSPADAFQPWLEHLGLERAFDTVINDAAKPFGMPAALEAARQAVLQTGQQAAHETAQRDAEAASPAQPPVSERTVLSVGDIWGNDLEHVAARGGSTILIDRFGTGLGSPGRRVRDFAAAAGAIAAWADLPAPVNIR